MQPLSENYIEGLKWPSLDFALLRLGSPPGLSYASAVLSALYKPYIIGKVGDMPIERKEALSNFNPALFQVNIFILQEGQVFLEKAYEYKQPSILLLKFTNEKYPQASHYETVGINERNLGFPYLKTVFHDEDPLIMELRKNVTTLRG